MLGTDKSFVGNTEGAMQDFSRSDRIYHDDDAERSKKSGKADTSAQTDSVDEIIQNKIAPAIAEDALTAILREARGKQVVILNEAHHVPMHRAFAMLLARELRKIGFEYLACETFLGEDLSPLAKNYVNDRTGYYTAEPMYANFLRDAIKQNWKFISYEASLPLANQRESKQAKNLVDRIFKKNPKARVFIYVGYSHANEFPEAVSDNDESKMAAQLKRLTGIDPLTIDQTTLFQQYDTQRQFDLYQAALKKQPGNKAFVLMSGENTYLKLAIPEARVDMQVVHPVYRIDAKTGRPSWLSSMAGFTPYPIPKELLPEKGQRAIYAYHLKDPLDAIPADVIVVEAGKPAPKLMLPKGEFRFAVED